MAGVVRLVADLNGMVWQARFGDVLCGVAVCGLAWQAGLVLVR